MHFLSIFRLDTEALLNKIRRLSLQLADIDRIRIGCAFFYIMDLVAAIIQSVRG